MGVTNFKELFALGIIANQANGTYLKGRTKFHQSGGHIVTRATALIVLRQDDGYSFFGRPGCNADIAINAPRGTTQNATALHLRLSRPDQ